MTVFALHEPVRYDRRSNRMVKIDLDMASDFGELRIVFPGEERPPKLEGSALEHLRSEMAKFKPRDRLVLVGDMDLIAFASVLAARAAGGKLTLLKWHSRERRYYEVEAPEGLLS